MGFLKHLFLWPVSGPIYLTRFSLDKVQGVVRDNLTDVDRVKEELLELQLRHELGDLDDDAYVEEETRLMAQLREVRRWREQFGMGTRGGVVQVQGAEASAEEQDEAPRAFTGGASLDVSLDWDDEENDDA